MKLFVLLTRFALYLLIRTGPLRLGASGRGCGAVLARLSTAARSTERQASASAPSVRPVTRDQ